MLPFDIKEIKNLLKGGIGGVLLLWIASLEYKDTKKDKEIADLQKQVNVVNGQMFELQRSFQNEYKIVIEKNTVVVERNARVLDEINFNMVHGGRPNYNEQ